MPAAAYLRRSSAPSSDARTVSFEMQEAAVQQLAARHGDTLAVIHTDWAKSGGNTKRPGYQELLRAVDARSIDVIYAYSLSRLSRSLLDFADLMERCKAHEVAVRFVKDGSMDWSTASGRGFANMTAVFAQMERELAMERSQSAYAARRERGDALGQAPYGSAIVEGRIVDRPTEPLEAVLDAYREAGSFGGAAELLNARGVPTRRQGTTWGHTAVARMVRRAAPADLEIPLALGRPKARAVGPHALSGLLRCPCGATLTGRRGRNRDGSPYVEYYCSRAYKVPGHGTVVVREHLILDAIQEEAARLEPDLDGYRQTVADDDAERARLAAKRDRVVEAFLDGVMGKPERDRRLAEVDEQMAGLRASSIVELLPPAIDWSWPAPKLNAVLRAMWHGVDMDERLRPRMPAEWRIPEWRAP